jgi:N-methylhydantoinase A
MRRESRSHASAAAGERSVLVRRSCFMRYAGQGHEISVALPDRPLIPSDAALLREAFEREYQRLFARFIPKAQIEIMSWVVLATTPTEPPAGLAAAPRRPAAAAIGERSVFDAALGTRICVPVFERRDLQPGSSIGGPVLIVEEGTSTFVSSGFDVCVDAGSALVLTAKPAAN